MDSAKSSAATLKKGKASKRVSKKSQVPLSPVSESAPSAGMSSIPTAPSSLPVYPVSVNVSSEGVSVPSESPLENPKSSVTVAAKKAKKSVTFSKPVAKMSILSDPVVGTSIDESKSKDLPINPSSEPEVLDESSDVARKLKVKRFNRLVQLALNRKRKGKSVVKTSVNDQTAPSEKTEPSKIDQIMASLERNKPDWVARRRASRSSNPILSPHSSEKLPEKDPAIKSVDNSVIDEFLASVAQDSAEKSSGQDPSVPAEPAVPESEDTEENGSGSSNHSIKETGAQDKADVPMSDIPGSSEPIAKEGESVTNQEESNAPLFVEKVSGESSVPDKEPISEARDTVFEDILEQIEKAGSKSKKRKSKISIPSRRWTRQMTDSSCANEDSSSDQVEILDPIPKKTKLNIGKPPSSQGRVSSPSLSVGGEIKKKSSSSKSLSKKGGLTVDGVWFHSKAASKRWSIIQKRKVIPEGIVSEEKWQIPEIIEKLKESGLLFSVQSAKPFEEQVVREVIGNISEEFGDILSENYGKVQVRGSTIDLSPSVINEFLKIPMSAMASNPQNWHSIARELTNDKVKNWKGLTLESKHLTTMYSLLQGICIKNWIPVTHRASISMPVAALIYRVGKGEKIDLGEIVLQQLVSHALSVSPIHPIGHPSTIYQLVIKQAPEILYPSPSMVVPKAILADWKLFHFHHFIDVNVPPTIKIALCKQGYMKEDPQSSSPSMPDLPTKPRCSRKFIIQSLESQLRTLDQTRQETAELIHALKATEDQEEDVVDGVEEEPSE